MVRPLAMSSSRTLTNKFIRCYPKNEKILQTVFLFHPRCQSKNHHCHHFSSFFLEQHCTYFWNVASSWRYFLMLLFPPHQARTSCSIPLTIREVKISDIFGYPKIFVLKFISRTTCAICFTAILLQPLIRAVLHLNALIWNSVDCKIIVSLVSCEPPALPAVDDYYSAASTTKPLPSSSASASFISIASSPILRSSF